MAQKKIAKKKPDDLIVPLSRGDSTKWQKFVDKVEVPAELPILPDPLREFAYRYALEVPRGANGWAVVFAVRGDTIRRWLHREDVIAYVKKLRYDRRVAMGERLQRLEVAAVDKLQELMEQPFEPETIGEIRKGIQDVLNLFGRTASEKGEPQQPIPSISTNVTVQQGQVAAQKQSVAIDEGKSIEQLKQEITELEEEDKLLFGEDSDVT